MSTSKLKRETEVRNRILDEVIEMITAKQQERYRAEYPCTICCEIMGFVNELKTPN